MMRFCAEPRQSSAVKGIGVWVTMRTTNPAGFPDPSWMYPTNACASRGVAQSYDADIVLALALLLAWVCFFSRAPISDP
jgi:hypothetical protein